MSEFLFCPIHDDRRYKQVCEHLCHKRKDGRLDKNHSRCSAAIGKYKCPVVIELYPRKKREKVAS